jgi:hypothetical protein
MEVEIHDLGEMAKDGDMIAGGHGVVLGHPDIQELLEELPRLLARPEQAVRIAREMVFAGKGVHEGADEPEAA